MAPESHVQALVVITVFSAISLALFALRIFSRYLLKNWGWDDVFVIIAVVLAIGMCATSWGVNTIHTKQGYPPEYFPPGRVPYTIKGKQYNLANQLLYFPILTCVRASIFAFILSLRGLLNVTAFSIVRAVIVVENFSKTPREQIYDTKYTYANIETNCAIWAAATPALKSLIARLFPRWWETRRTPYPTSSNQLPHASSLQTSTTPLAGSWKGSQVASSNDPQSHPLDSLPPLRRSDDSEAELRRFEYDTKVSTLFRTGQNYIYS
ncbi:hypothetical protein BDBG_03498 [Blastomyces gilchristii SLH14081]|uniref:Rhodopsin domain-containing protein n=1 Tax=Blastomyces gilchristii (strain SLH14081) TaxID=559298 RepID=A0A179UJQ1_BLAGS|nr:uncharacterized protein BDBG_03498 [Blastomyces gilchristii SLH14081]OAT07439.1 hypothetical protein BDBG_03498 [Blastomyces gilchristii SLH14081]